MTSGDPYMEAARRLWSTITYEAEGRATTDGIIQIIAKALRGAVEEERERCAKIAEKYRDASHPDFASYHDCNSIAAAIRGEAHRE